MPYITPTEEQRSQHEQQKLSDAIDFVTFYFSPWGTAKGARWEEISDGKAFSGENAMRHLAKLLDIKTEE